MTRMHAWIAAGAAVALAAGLGGRPAAQPAAQDTARIAGHAAGKKIIFLAGPKDHGIPGRHEYEKDLRVLASALEAASNLEGVRTEVYVGKAPTDLSVYADAAAIVVESSSDRDARETMSRAVVEAVDGPTLGIDPLNYL